MIDDPGSVVFSRRFTRDFEGTEYDQEEWFFLVRTVTFDPSTAGWTDTERATMQAHRWWTIEELRTTGEAVFPENLADRLEHLLAQ